MNRAIRRASRAFARETRREWHPFERVDLDPAWRMRHAARLARYIASQGDLLSCWTNNRFAVQVFARARDGGDVLHLAVRRHDGEEIQGWSDLQRIKNELTHPSRAALEVYPPEDELVDQANMRHLFVLPEGEPAPFTIRGRWD